MGSHAVSDAYYDAGTVQVRALLKRKVFVNDRLVELAESFRCLIHRLRILYLTGCSLVIKVQRRVVILLAQEAEEWIFVGR